MKRRRGQKDQRERGRVREEFTCSTEFIGGSSTKVPAYQINKMEGEGGGWRVENRNK